MGRLRTVTRAASTDAASLPCFLPGDLGENLFPALYGWKDPQRPQLSISADEEEDKRKDIKNH